jgi:hypothetical protein
MRKIKSSYSTFSRPASFQIDQFRTLLRSHDDKVLPEKFFEMVDRRRGDLAKLQQTLFFLQVPTFMFLTLALAGSDVNISLFGLTVGKNLREALILVSSGLGLWTSWVGSQKQTLENILRAKHQKMSKGNKLVADMLNAGYGLDILSLPTPTEKHLNISGWHVFFIILFVIAAVGITIAGAFGIAYVHIITLIEIYKHPNISFTASLIVITFVAMADAISFSWLMVSTGVLPYRNNERISRLAKLIDTSPQQSQKVFDKIMKQHKEKSLWRRILTRPTIPEKFEP